MADIAVLGQRMAAARDGAAGDLVADGRPCHPAPALQDN